MRTMCSREIFTKKCRQQQIFDSDLKGAWHYNHVTFTPIAKNFMLYCRLIYMLSILCVRLTIKEKVGIPESFKVGRYRPKKTGSSHLKFVGLELQNSYFCLDKIIAYNKQKWWHVYTFSFYRMMLWEILFKERNYCESSDCESFNNSCWCGRVILNYLNLSRFFITWDSCFLV